MKKSIFIIAALTIILVACAQNPPKSAADNFNMKFQNATKVKWEQEEENEWEAEFKMNGDEMSACFDNAGQWLETEKELKENELPATVFDTVNAEYAGYKIEEAAEIEKPDFKGYEIAIEKGKEELELLVTADGKITVNQESEEDED